MNKALPFSIAASAAILSMQSDAIAAECASKLSGQSTVSAILFCMVEMNREIDELKSTVNRVPEPAVPRGAVIAFDRAGKCPEGWRVSSQAAGRVIIGVGQGNTDENKRLLTERTYLEEGGAETVTLTEAQMPSHKHSVDYVRAVGSGFSIVDEGTAFIRRIGRSDANKPETAHSFQTKEFERGSAHNNMPPYIALYFCKKD